MGALSISLPASAVPTVVVRAQTFGLTTTEPLIDKGVAYMSVIGDARKCLHATSLTNVTRLGWSDRLPLNADDHKSNGIKPVTFKER